jgi:hypothetical protein
MENQEQYQRQLNNSQVNPLDVQIMRENSIPQVQQVLNFLEWGVENGELKPLEAFHVVSTLEKMFKVSKIKIDSHALNEAESFGKSSFEAHGLKFELRNGGRTYDYKNIPEWIEAKARLTEIEEKAKLSYLSHEKGLLGVDESTGEIQALPSVTFRKSSLIIKSK